MMKHLAMALLATWGIAQATPPTTSTGINLQLPEVSSPAHIMEISMKTEDNSLLTQQQMQQAREGILHRCFILGMDYHRPRIDNKDGQLFLRLYYQLKPEDGTPPDQALQTIINERPACHILQVHPRSDEIIKLPEVQQAIARYEKDITLFCEGVGNIKEPPALPSLPAVANATGYKLVEWPCKTVSGRTVYDYLVVQSPDMAQQEQRLISNADIQTAKPDIPRKDIISIYLTPRGAATMYRLTSSLRFGKDRLAVVIDNSVIFAPTVFSPLRQGFTISGMASNEIQRALLGLQPPLPCQILLKEKATNAP